MRHCLSILVHHPLDAFLPGLTSHRTSLPNTLGFFTGLVFVVGVAIVLYEIHLRILPALPLFRKTTGKASQITRHPMRCVCINSPVLVCAAPTTAMIRCVVSSSKQTKSPSLAAVLTTNSGKPFLRRSLRQRPDVRITPCADGRKRHRFITRCRQPVADSFGKPLPEYSLRADPRHARPRPTA